MRGFTNGDSSIHLCYHSDNFYRYKGYSYPYTEKTNEFWDIRSGTWANGGSDISQYGYMVNSNGGELGTKTEYANMGIYARMKSVSPTSKTDTIMFRADIQSPNNRYYIRNYNSLVNGHSVEIIKNINSVETILPNGTSSNPIFLDSGKMKEMTLIEDSNNIRLWINNIPVKWANGNYYLTDSSVTSGAFGIKNDTTSTTTKFYQTAFFESSVAKKGDLWGDFTLVDYNLSGDTKTGSIRIPGKIGGHIQTGSPDSRTLTITGRLLSQFTDAKSFDELMFMFISNELPVFVHTPVIKISGVITSYSPPKPRKGTKDAYYDFSFDMIENWFYEV